MSPPGDQAPAHHPGYPAALAAAAVAYAVLHHVGSLPAGLGEVPWGEARTRWADWIDLFTPYLVLTPALLAVAAARPGRRVVVLAGVGAVAYAQGHGAHLAANSIGNVSPSRTAHLWDETAGHLLWYAGAALLIAALAATMCGHGRPPVAAHLLGLAVGLTWASNALGGGTAWFALPFAVGLSWFGWRHRGGLPVVLLSGFAPGAVAVALGVWGAG